MRTIPRWETFKVRGGMVYVRRLGRRSRGLITASRGNHGQSLAFAARRVGLPVTIVVPAGNALEKTAAMRALGASVVEHGRDFDAAKQHAMAVAAEHRLHFVPTFHRHLVLGVASLAYELFTAGPALDALYVPIGLGSAICGAIGVRNALGLATEVIGVVPECADAYHRSLAAGRLISIPAADTFADGLAIRVPDPSVLEFLRQPGVRAITVSEQQIAEAIRILFSATHSCAEGAGAASFAGLLKERSRQQGRRVGVVLTGQNIDRDWMATILAGGVPSPRGGQDPATRVHRHLAAPDRTSTLHGL